MTDQRSTDTDRPQETPAGLAEQGIADPKQPPMDDAAGGPQADEAYDEGDTATEELSVQGGE